LTARKWCQLQGAFQKWISELKNCVHSAWQIKRSMILIRNWNPRIDFGMITRYWWKVIWITLKGIQRPLKFYSHEVPEANSFLRESAVSVRWWWSSTRDWLVDTAESTPKTLICPVTHDISNSIYRSAGFHFIWDWLPNIIPLIPWSYPSVAKSDLLDCQILFCSLLNCIPSVANGW
jgi:hypothetical protein